METKTEGALEVPVLSSDHKLKLLLAQRDAMAAKITFDHVARQHQDKVRAVSDIAVAIGQELKLDPDKWIINIDALTFEPAK